MNLKNLFSEDNDSRAVSPVIGVILMVAITVILAAVIGTFVLGLGDSVNSAPQASFNFDYEPTNDQITISHRGGDTIDTNSTEIRVAGNAITAGDDPSIGTDDETFAEATDGTFSAGGSVELYDTASGFEQGDEITIVTTGGDRQSIIGSFDVPEDSSSFSP